MCGVFVCVLRIYPKYLGIIWEYQTTLPASWETCMQVKKQELESDMEQWTGSKLGKEHIKAVYCHSAYLAYMQSTLCEMPDWMNHSWNQDCWEKYQQPQICKWYYPKGRKWRGTKEPPMKVKEESEKAGLKPNIQKTKIMASGSIASWQIDGETMDTGTDFLFLSSKITWDGDCSHEIKRRLLLGRKVMTNLDSIFKSNDKDITLPTKVCLVKAVVFPIVMYGCES